MEYPRVDAEKSPEADFLGEVFDTIEDLLTTADPFPTFGPHPVTWEALTSHPINRAMHRILPPFDAEGFTQALEQNFERRAAAKVLELAQA